MLMRTFLLVLLGMLPPLPSYAQAPPFGWVSSAGGKGNEAVSAIAVDAAGNVYTTGHFTDTADFDPGGLGHDLNAEKGTAFIWKLNASGKLIWARKLDGTAGSYGSSIQVDVAGNVFATGHFSSGSLTFNIGTSTTTLVNRGYSDIYAFKLDSAGNTLWANSYGGAGEEYAGLLALDKYGHILISGNLLGSSDFDPGPGTMILTSAGQSDALILKIDAVSGQLIWARNIGGEANDNGHFIGIDSTGNVYTSGLFEKSADFDPGAGVVRLASAFKRGPGCYLLCLDASGRFSWVRHLDGNEVSVTGLALDSAGHIHISGNFKDTIDFDPGPAAELSVALSYRQFVLKLNARGDLIWHKEIASTAWDNSLALHLDLRGNVYCSGVFSDTLDVDSGPAVHNLIPKGNYELYLFRLSPSGDFNWALSYGSGDEAFYFPYLSITTDVSGNIYTAGSFQDSADFDPWPGTAKRVSQGETDVYILKLGRVGMTGADVRLVDTTAGWLLLAPNPASNLILIKSQHALQAATIFLYNINGQLVRTWGYINGHTFPIDLSMDAPGTYFIDVVVGNEQRRLRFVKQ